MSLCFKYAIDSVDMQGQTALMLAAEEGRVDVVRHLVSIGADLTVTDHNDRNALMCAAVGGHVECMKIITDGLKRLK